MTISRAPFATRADIEARHPRDIAVLAADEQTRLVDWPRVEAAVIDVSTEIRAILAARYTPAQLDRLDAESEGVLRLFAIDMALYRVSLSFGRQTDAIKLRYETAVKRLEGIAVGRGGLTMTSDTVTSTDTGMDGGGIAPNEAVIVGVERMFTRQRLGRI